MREREWEPDAARRVRQCVWSGGDTLAYDSENRLTSITVGGTTTTFVYDGDGNRVKKTVGATTTFYVGNHYEVTNGVATKYYYFGKQRVALRTSAGVTYIHTDHLGSTSVTTNASGQCTSAQLYYPYGSIRTPAPTTPCSGTPPTDYGFTGQRLDASSGLMYYGARYYDAALGRFISADTLVPQAGNPQALNRYAYVGNNPLKYTDPSGHCWGVASGARSLPSYDVTCGNLDMALTIVQHPNANAVEKAFAGWYLATEGTAHVALAVGSGILAWEAIVPTLTAGGTGAAIAEGACADGDCTNEVAAAQSALPKVENAFSQAASAIQSPTREQVIARLGEVIQPRLSALREIAGKDALIGFRGSLARGTVGNPTKATFGQPIDLSHFDVDAFIVSDRLRAFGQWGNKITELRLLQREILYELRQYPEFAGLKAQGFGFRIFSVAEAIEQFGNENIYFR